MLTLLWAPHSENHWNRQRHKDSGNEERKPNSHKGSEVGSLGQGCPESQALLSVPKTSQRSEEASLPEAEVGARQSGRVPPAGTRAGPELAG